MPIPTSFGITNASDSQFAPQFDSYLSGFLNQHMPNITSDQINQGLASAQQGWGGAFGSGSNPFTAAYQAAINIGNASGFDFASAQPYDQSIVDQQQQAAVDRSPEGQARAADTSIWNSIRDPIEALGAVAGNYFVPGSGLVTSHLVSNGAQDYLSSDAGRLAMIGGGVAGGVNGNFWGTPATGASTGSSSMADSWNLGDAPMPAEGTFNSPVFTVNGMAGSGAVEPWMGTDPTVENAGTAMSGDYIPAGATEPWMGTDPTVETGGGGILPALQRLRVSSGAPVVEMGKNFTGFGSGNGVLSDLSTVARSGLTGGSFGGSPGLGGIASILSIGSGLYGIMQARKLRELAKVANPQMATQMAAPGVAKAVDNSGAKVDQALSTADPWGTSGGMNVSVDQLKSLIQDPSAIQNTPGYKAGLQAVERKMASQGYNGSGNMMTALADYGGNFYNNAVQQLAGLSGATQAPSVASSLGIQGAGVDLSGGDLQLQLAKLAQGGQLSAADLALKGSVASNDLLSKSLGSIGYGAGGGGYSASAAQIAQLMKLQQMGLIG